jgi:hypothetical protein
MIARVTRAAFLLILVGMIAAYAVQVANSQPEPQGPPLPTDRMYS